MDGLSVSQLAAFPSITGTWSLQAGRAGGERIGGNPGERKDGPPAVHRAFSPEANLSILLSPVPPGRPATPPAMMPGQIPDPSVTAGSLPGLGPLTGLPSSALTTEELKYADIRNIGAMIAPLHFLEVKLGKRPQPVKSEVRPLFSRQNPCFQVWF